MTLPQCRWRSPCGENAERIVCSSDRVLTLSHDGCIPAALCETCKHADKPLRRQGIKQPCIHLGPATGETVECKTCKGRVKIKLMACAVFGKCSPKKRLPDVACCVGCARRETAR